MIASNFPESNCNFGAPSDMDESQVGTIQAYRALVRGGSLDGATIVVTAWRPTPEEVEHIKQGKPIFLTVMGGLPPHFLTTEFQQAINVA